MSAIRTPQWLQAVACAGCVAGVLAVAAVWPGTSAGAEPDAAPAWRYPDHVRLLDAIGPDHLPRRIRTLDQWQARRRHILEQMQVVMGPWPGPERRVPLDVEVVSEEQTPRFVRRQVRFTPEPGDRVPAILHLPTGTQGADKLPAVLCLHQTTAVGKAEPAGLAGLPNLHYAAELAERGFVTLSVDYPNYGEYKFDPYAHGYVSATMKGIWNHSRAVDLLCSLPQVDPHRIGVIGHSLGGHNSLFVAVFDERLRCVVSCCGFCAFTHYYGGDVTGWSHRGYMPLIAERYHARGVELPFDFPEVLAALAPRACLAVAPVGDSNFDVAGVALCVSSAAEVYGLAQVANRLAAIYPDAEHDFPLAARQAAYAWLEHWLPAP